MKIDKLFCILLIITTFAANAQQDPQFSQNMFNHLTVNPGFAGSSGLINASLLNRYQWVGFPGAPVTTVLNVEAATRIIGENDGIGLSILNDVIGYEKNVSVGINYSWRKKIGQGKLGTGISVGIMNKNLKPEWMQEEGSDLINSADPGLPQQEANGILADIGAGLFYKHIDYYLALSVKHINQPSFSFEESGRYSLMRHYYLSGGYTFAMGNEKYEVLPSFFLKSDATTTQIDINCIVQYDKRIWGGLSYRPGDAIVILLGTEMQNGLKFGYSYDISTSALSSYNSGSHELYVAYSVLFNRKKAHKYRSVRFL
jgi:type IX secretion system PorP/SprF family membrane protein